jgi:2-polyprenyl-6-methoxyphenol hydroxylase-like FAD-dependent oxidoreductase
VGVRAAGAATALQVARRGLQVLVIDRARRGSDTLSTHALMRKEVLQLRRWGLLDHVIASGAPPLTRTIVHYGDDAVPVDLKPWRRRGRTLCAAAHRARPDPDRSGRGSRVQTEFEVRMTDLLRDDEGRVTGVDAADVSGARFTARASFVLGADGKPSLVARRVNASVYRSGSWSGGLICAYWSEVDVDGYEWFFRRWRRS